MKIFRTRKDLAQTWTILPRTFMRFWSKLRNWRRLQKYRLRKDFWNVKILCRFKPNKIQCSSINYYYLIKKF